MNIRKTIEDWEKNNLSKYATQSINATSTRQKENGPSLRTDFQIDRDRILHSVSFRLLKHKTQVFLSTSGEEFRTRLTHTLEVSSIGRYIARSLDLNQDLVEAIALGHDLGHTPFGHIGEKVIDELSPFKFAHGSHSVRVVESIENSGKGLELTDEVKKGIRQHSKGAVSMHDLKRSSIIEGEVVQFADWLAYVNHDVDDAFNMGLIIKDDLPESSYEVLGYTFQQRLVTMIQDVIINSMGKPHIYMSKEVLDATDELRAFLYGYVYNLDYIARREKMARKVMTSLHEYYLDNYELVLEDMPFLKDESHERGVCDYLATLTDLRAQELFSKIISAH